MLSSLHSALAFMSFQTYKTDARLPFPVVTSVTQLLYMQSKVVIRFGATVSQRDRATHELLRFAKLRSGIFEPPFWGLRGNVDASCIRRCKKRGRLPIGDK